MVKRDLDREPWYVTFSFLLHLLTVKKFLLHSAAEFLCERKSSILWRWQKSCVAFFIRKFWLRTPIERVVFSDCWRISNAQSFSHLPNKILCDPPTPQQVFSPPRFWVVTWPAATRVFVQTTKGGREERSWERGCLRLWIVQMRKAMTSILNL